METNEQHETKIEIGTNVVAIIKMPIPLKELVGMIEHLEFVHGRKLRMTEQPKDWLQLFKP